MAQATGNVKEQLKKLVREAIPELNGFQFPMKAKVVKLYEAGGTVSDFNKRYSVDVQPLKIDGSIDEKIPVIPDVPIDILWAGNDRSVISLPPIGAIVRLEFYHWNPSMPYISGILADGYKIPSHPLGSFIIQQKNGVLICINPNGDIEIKTDKNISLKAGKAQMTLENSGAIEIGTNMVNISANGQISFSGGGNSVARIGDSVLCPSGTGTIVSGSSTVNCGG